MLRSPFIEIDPRGMTPLEVGVRDLSRFGGLTYRPCLRGLKATTATELGQTDGRYGFYNLENINKRKPSEAAYVVGASVAHLCLQRMPSGRGWVQVEARAQQQQQHELRNKLTKAICQKERTTEIKGSL